MRIPTLARPGLALAFGLSGFAQTAVAESAVPKIAKGTPYAKARTALVAQGWKPTRVSDADTCQPDDSRCTGRPEMQACSGTGLASCLFVWRKGKAEIEVTTVGELEPITVSRVSCRSGC